MDSPLFPDWDNNYTLKPLKRRSEVSVYCNNKKIGYWHVYYGGRWGYTPIKDKEPIMDKDHIDDTYRSSEFCKLLNQYNEELKLKRKYGKNTGSTLYNL